ncbi:MAG TPA: Rpn family recombination-promoting nuclease/putative transposase [Candidatus Ozemobacteraceae bacterium]|nr:Rpn family recombination-promoting nuclease/putative transposase [Candidatus Ozemobacteraceae bacterium]
MKTYSILNDFAFQWIFNQPGREKILMSLLNAILHLEGRDRISEIHYLNPFNPARFADSKKSVVDIKARDEKGYWYGIEAQVCHHSGFIKRTAFYLANIYSNQISKGEDFNALMPAISISFLGFTLFPESKRVQEIFHFSNQDNSVSLPETMSLQYIDLKRFDRRQADELRTPFEKWLHFMKFSKAYARINTNTTDLFPGEEELSMALAEHVKLNADQEMRVRLEDRERARVNELIIRSETIKEGRAQGLAEGRAEGLALGLAEGKAEAQIEIAVKLADKGMTNEQIAEITGLQLNDLENIIKRSK